MEPIIEYHENLFTTRLFWDCECGDRYIHSRVETICLNCRYTAQDQPNSKVEEVLFNAKLWNLDGGLVDQVGEALQQQHPLLFRAFELGFDPEEEVMVVNFCDVILHLEKALQDPQSVPAEDLAQSILESSRFVRVDWQEWDHYTAETLKSFQTRAKPLAIPDQEVERG